MLNHKQVTEIILQIERQVALDDFSIEGVHLWPLVRTQIASQLLKSEQQTPRPTTSDAYRDFLILRAKDISRQAIRWLRMPIFLLQRSLRLRRIRVQHIENILIVRHDQLDNDPNFVDGDFVQGWKSSIQQLGSNQTLKMNDPDFEFLLDLQRRNSPFCTSHRQRNEVASLQAVLLPFNIQIDAGLILKQLHDIKNYAAVFDLLFKRWSVERVFFTVLFHNTSFALSYLSRRSRLLSIEIQHGQQGEFNPINNNYTCIPNDGYALLPKVFWVWGRIGQKRKLLMTRNRYHRVIIGGNPKINHYRAKRSLRPRNQRGKKRVLFAMQPLADCIPDHLLSAITILSDRFEFWFRLHPAMLSRLEEIQNKLIPYPVEFEHPTSRDLFDVLEDVDIVTTLWSTVVYEGLALDKKGIVLNRNGQELFRESIELGEIDCCLNVDELCKSLESCEGIYATSFFATDEQTLRTQIALLRE